jgi:TRAP-type mannitol/chloroaromatic compound transport system permease small subunit
VTVQLLSISRAIDAFSARVAVVANYLVLFAALLSAFNATIRYSLNGLLALGRDYPLFRGLDPLVRWYGHNSNSLLEAQWYMFAAIVLFGAAHTLRMNEHVRVDLVYGSVRERTRLWIDLLGAIVFLLPMCAVMIYFTWPWFVASWRMGEVSASAGGLLRWPVKLILPMGFALVALQGLSEIIKSIAALVQGDRREFAYEKPLQ